MDRSKSTTGRFNFLEFDLKLCQNLHHLSPCKHSLLISQIKSKISVSVQKKCSDSY